MKVVTPPRTTAREDRRLTALATRSLWAMLSVHHVCATGTRVEVRHTAGGLQADIIGAGALDQDELVLAREQVAAALQAAVPQARIQVDG